MTILVVAAHPDDEVLGCGGTVAKLSSKEDVYIAILGEGESSRYERRDQASQKNLNALQQQAREAGSALGAKSVSLHGLPDNRFDEKPLLEIVKCVEKVIDELEPAIIYTHHGGDLNIDHQITFRAVLTATRPMAGCPV